MVADLILHVGTHKTGSTAIQTAALHHAQRLRDQGVVFVRKPTGAGEIEVATTVDAAVSDPLRATIGAMVDAPGNDRIVLSYEGWVGDTSVGYTNAPAAAANLRAACADAPARVVVYLRRHDIFLASLYCQAVKIGSTDTLTTYLGTLADTWFRWADLLDAYSDAFGGDAVTTRFYEKDHAPAWSAVTDFFDEIGVAGVGDPPADPNPGLTSTAIELLRRVNVQRRGASDRLLRRVLEAEAPAAASAFFPPDMRDALLSIYADDCRRLRDDHRLDVPEWFTTGGVGAAPPLDDDVEALAIRTLGRLAGTATAALERAGVAIN